MTPKEWATYALSFEAWYAHYPRKVARGAAEKAFPKALKLAGLDDLIAGAQRYAEAVKGQDRRYVCHPSTWLNQKRWLDEYPVPANTALGGAILASRVRARLAAKGIRTAYLCKEDIELGLREGILTPEQAKDIGL